MSDKDDEQQDDDEPAPKRGRGRPPGALSKLSQSIIAAAEAGGTMPHEFLLAIVRGEPIMTRVLSEDGQTVVGTRLMIPDLETRKDAAKAAAPYFAPKLSTIETIGAMNDHDLDAIIERAAREAALSFGVGGESASDEAQSSTRERRSARQPGPTGLH